MLSPHNSLSELEFTPEKADQAGMIPFIYQGKDGNTLPYRQLVTGGEKEGDFALLLFFHGAGSVGEDNYLQLRIFGPPLLRFFAAHPEFSKCVTLFPQCPKECKWVDVPWTLPEHTLPPEPSIHMKLTMELLMKKKKEFNISSGRTFLAGISMGGFAVWDIASRMPEEFAGIFAMCGGGDIAQAHKLKAHRIFCIHGGEDTVVLTKRSRDMVHALKEAGNKTLIYEELPGIQHNCWDDALKDDRAFLHLFQ